MPEMNDNYRKPLKFIADCHLGKLAKYLRLMGIDTLFFLHIEDSALIVMANQEECIILTHDCELSERKKCTCPFPGSH